MTTSDIRTKAAVGTIMDPASSFAEPESTELGERGEGPGECPPLAAEPESEELEPAEPDPAGVEPTEPAPASVQDLQHKPPRGQEAYCACRECEEQ